MPSAIDYPIDGTVQGPCPPGYMFFGKPACGCSQWDCRPDGDTALRIGLRTAAPATNDYSQPSYYETVFILGAETTGSGAMLRKGPWTDVVAEAQANGWHGPVSIVSIRRASDTQEEISRRITGQAEV